jgi:hypothetical protein
VALARIIARTLDRPPAKERLIERADAFSVTSSARAYLRALGIEDEITPETAVDRPEAQANARH